MGPLYQHEREVAQKMALLFDEAADGIGKGPNSKSILNPFLKLKWPRPITTSKY